LKRHLAAATAALALALTLACGVGPISNPIAANPTVAAAATSLANAQATLQPAFATVQSGIATLQPTAQALLATAQSGIATFQPTGQAFLATAQAQLASAVPGAAPGADSFASGGLGVSRSAWEAQHGAGSAEGGFESYEEKTFVVGYQGDRISHLEFLFNPAIDLDAARAQGKPLLPADSQLIRTYTTADGRTVDLYRSATLAARFADAPSLWAGGEPGDCIVLYRQASGRVASILLSLGDNP
jgi:hypothetical protein